MNGETPFSSTGRRLERTKTTIWLLSNKEWGMKEVAIVAENNAALLPV